jgi:hypothetical protein
MRRIFLIISISFSVLSLFSCATAVKINVALSSVDVSENSASNIHNFEADNILSYKDNIISATWDTDTSPLLLTLKNLTDKTIKIIWDNAAFIDINGNAGRIMHTGTKYSDRNDFQPPTIIPKKTSVIENIVPTRNVYFTDYGWVEGKLFIYKTNDYKETVNDFTGKHIKILIPIVVDNDTIEYIFDFKVKSVKKFTNTEYNTYIYYKNKGSN